VLVSEAKSKLPRRVVVSEVLDSRYGPGLRPISWDQRFEGVERVLADSGEEILLFSGGGQSSPAPGWELLLTKEAENKEQPAVLEWTLYGIRSSKL
jgi:hypothetical protein